MTPLSWTADQHDLVLPLSATHTRYESHRPASAAYIQLTATEELSSLK